MHLRWHPKSPSLLPTIVCYADILGFRELTECAHRLGEETEFLQKIKSSLAKAYDIVREAKTLNEQAPSIFDMKVFTDNIVVAQPLHTPRHKHAEPELGNVLKLFAQVQASLAADGFLLRGAITYGDHYQDNDIAYGKALIEAIDLDKTGGSPRLVLASSVEPLVSKQLSQYDDHCWAPLYQELLEDQRDGRLFINYLAPAFELVSEGLIDYDLLASHSKIVREGLNLYQSDPHVRVKYEWMARYHNYVCQEFADRYSNLSGEEADTQQAAEAAEAQSVLRHKVPCEDLLSKLSPRPLDA